MREYECCEFYRVLAPDTACFFCDHCTDIFWDFSHGPYMFLCDVGEDTNKGARGECSQFKEEMED